MNNTNTINAESEAGMFCCSETEGYLLPLLNLPFNTSCLIFHCDFIDGTAGAWVSTDVATPLHEQVQSYLQSRRIRGLTTNTTLGIYSFHCRDLGEAMLVGQMLGAPNGSNEEITLNNEINRKGITVSLAFCDSGAARRISNHIDQIHIQGKKRRRQRVQTQTLVKKGFGSSEVQTSCCN